MFNLYFKLYPHLVNFSLIKNGLPYLWLQKTAFPITLNFLLTSRCNFKCKMCSFFATKQLPTPDIPSEKVIKFIKTISRYKPVIHLGGGEPFVHQDIYRIITEIKKYNLKLVITTNGYLVDTEKIMKLDVDYIIFSLYGPPEVHNEITGIRNAYQTAIEKIKSLPPNKIIVSTILMSENIDYLEEFVEEIFTSKVSRIKIENLNYITPEEYSSYPFQIGNYTLTPTTLIRPNFSHSEVEKFWRVTKKLKTKYRSKIFLKPNLNKKEFFHWYLGKERKIFCRFITHSVFIDSDGTVIPCQFLRECKLGNISSQELKYIWRSQNFQKLRGIINRVNLPVCKRCCKT